MIATLKDPVPVSGQRSSSVRPRISMGEQGLVDGVNADALARVDVEESHESPCVAGLHTGDRVRRASERNPPLQWFIRRGEVAARGVEIPRAGHVLIPGLALEGGGVGAVEAHGPHGRARPPAERGARVRGVIEAGGRRRPARGRCSVRDGHQRVAHEEVPLPPVAAGLVVGEVGTPQLARLRAARVVADCDALAPAIAHQEEASVGRCVVVDAVQTSVRRVHLPSNANAVCVAIGQVAGVLRGPAIAGGGSCGDQP